MINATNDNKPQNTNPGLNPVPSVTKNIPMNGETATVIEKLNQSEPQSNDRIDVMASIASNRPSTVGNSYIDRSSKMAEVTLDSVPKATTSPMIGTPAMSSTSAPTMAPSKPPAMEKPPGFDNRHNGLSLKKKFNIKMVGGLLVLLLIVLGAGAGLFLSQQTQDLRQQAAYGDWCQDDADCNGWGVCLSTGYCGAPGTTQPGDGCSIQNNPCTAPQVCHCQDGNTCNDPQCEDPDETVNWCQQLNQDRWCVNQGGHAYTCCAEGYSCCSGYNGCCANNPPTNPPPTTPPPSLPPTYSCNSTCTTNAQCTGVNAAYTCDATSNRCRLATNPTSTTCQPPAALTCNSACTTNTQCSSVNPAWSCDTTTSKCRLTTNPTSLTCQPPNALTCNDACTTNTQCSSVNPLWSCDTTSNKCRLTTNPTSLTCQPPNALTCNDACTTNTQCSSVNPAWSCDMTSSKCRLTTNPTSLTCEPAALTCNDACTTNTQCSSVNPAWSCDTTSNKCRLTDNPTSLTCEPAIIPGEPMCKDVAILDVNNNELNPATDAFSIGMVLKFRCAADDPDLQVTNYEFKVTEPDGNIVQGSAINPAGSSSTSQEYQITQYLTHQVQCRVCTGTACQDWVSIIN